MARHGTKWEAVVESALQKGPASEAELKRKLGLHPGQVRYGIRALVERDAVRLDVVRLEGESVGKARWMLKTPETALDELEKGKKIIRGEYSFIRVPEALHNLVIGHFKGRWDLGPWFRVGLDKVKEDELSPSEAVGYHLDEARYAFHRLTEDVAEKNVLGKLPATERDLLEGFRKGSRLQEGPAGWEHPTPPRGWRGGKERWAAAVKLSDRVRADIQIEVERLEREPTILEVLGGGISLDWGSTNEDVLFEESIRKTLHEQPRERFNESAKDFFSIYYEIVTNDPMVRGGYLDLPLIHPKGHEKFLELIEKWGIDSSRTGLAINQERPFIHAANAALREINARRDLLDSPLKHRLTKALEAQKLYTRFGESKTKWTWGIKDSNSEGGETA